MTSLSDWMRSKQPNFESVLRSIKEAANKRHGGPWDRGGADYYYWRYPNPHYYERGTYEGKKFSQDEMTLAEVDEYMAGYVFAMRDGDRKDWG